MVDASKDGADGGAGFFTLSFVALAVTGLIAGLVALPTEAQESKSVVVEVPPKELPTVTVIGITPLHGTGQAKNEIATPVQSATAKDIAQSGALELSDFLNTRMGSVSVNNIQGNPYQMDVNYRGYTASPLLGTPQGLSVYVDGVRMNQPFGDVVSWDLIPKNAISSINLMPGSNPLFGLNTLGGALSVQTKDGLTHPGSSVQLSYGSWTRRALELEHGGSNDKGLNWYVSGNWFAERGWRDDSPSAVRQVFGKLGWKNADTQFKLSLAYSNNKLTGNGLQEESMLANSYSSVYTKPDITRNKAMLLNLMGSHTLSDTLLMTGNVYYRDIRNTTFNGDGNQDALGNVSDPGLCNSAQLLAGADAGNCTGLLNRTNTRQKNYGFSGQLTLLNDWSDRRNQLVVGGGFDASRSKYNQLTELGLLNADRSITGVGAFADGVGGGMLGGTPFDNRVDLSSKTQTWSLLASDTLSITEKLHLTLSARYNRTRVDNADQINPGGGTNSLDGSYRYGGLNPAVGLTYSPTESVNAYFSASQGRRAPTAIELGCANPEQPCKLPNAMAGDPPLKQVVTRTFEAGLRGTTPYKIQWEAGVFRAENRDDILFVASEQTGYGYFKNFGQTRRQGVELGLSTAQSHWRAGVHYTYLDATYQSAEIVNGAGNSSNSAATAGQPGMDGNIQIQPGHKIPLISRHMLKVHGDYSIWPNLRVGASVVAVSQSYARGNENNAQQSDGQYYQGTGRVLGYAVWNLNASYEPSRQWQVVAQVNNVFDKQYATAAQLGATAFNSAGVYTPQPYGDTGALQHASFVAPGAPRSFLLAVRYTF